MMKIETMFEKAEVLEMVKSGKSFAEKFGRLRGALAENSDSELDKAFQDLWQAYMFERFNLGKK